MVDVASIFHILFLAFTDIDECAEGGGNNCDTNAACTNKAGSFTCACNEGYDGNGVTCQGNITLMVSVQTFWTAHTDGEGVVGNQNIRG